MAAESWRIKVATMSAVPPLLITVVVAVKRLPVVVTTFVVPAVDLGCGCGEPGPSGCDNVCGSTAVDLGCGCGEPGRVVAIMCVVPLQ